MEVGSFQAEGLRLWYLILQYGSRYKLLQAAKKDGHSGCYRYIIELVVKHDIFKGEDIPFMAPVEIRNNS